MEFVNLETLLAKPKFIPIVATYQGKIKVIEKLVIGDKIFQPAPQQQSLSRPTRSVETSFEGIFWAFALLAFAAALMFLINTTK